ncbi:MAG: hypothetical protein V1738_00480 [Patescibacteria group bacterium]
MVASPFYLLWSRFMAFLWQLSFGFSFRPAPQAQLSGPNALCGNMFMVGGYEFLDEFRLNQGEIDRRNNEAAARTLARLAMVNDDRWSEFVP